MTDENRACPYCGAVNWLCGFIGEFEAFLSPNIGELLIGIEDARGGGRITMIDECQNCGAVVSL